MSPTNRSDDVHLISDLWDQAVNQFDVLAREGKLIHGPFTTTVRDEDGFKVGCNFSLTSQQPNYHS